MEPGASLKAAIRQAVANPRWTLTLFMCLSCGVGVNGAVFRAAHSVFLGVPPGLKEPARLVRLYERERNRDGTESIGPVASYPRYRALRHAIPAFAELAAYRTEAATAGDLENTRQVTMQLVTPSYFRLLGAAPALGRLIEESPAAPVPEAVVSDRFWRSVLNADSGTLGRRLLIGSISYTIVGIAQPGFQGAEWVPVDVWVPLEVAAADRGYGLECAGCRWLKTIGRLVPAVTRDGAAAQASAVASRLPPSSPGDSALTMFVGPLQESLGPNGRGDQRLGFQLLLLGLLVLGIMCANLANLTVANSLTQLKSAVIRRALGATNRHLAFDVFRQQAVAFGLGLCGALLLGSWSSSLLFRLVLRREAADGLGWGFALGCIALAGAAWGVAGIVPALLTQLAAGWQLARERADAVRPRTAARAVLAAGQVAVTFVLVVCAGLFTRSLQKLNDVRLGMDAERLIAVRIETIANAHPKAGINAAYREALERVERLPGVEGASLTIGTPFQSSIALAFSAPGVDETAFDSENGGPYIQAVSTNYFATLGTRVVRGRAFGPGDQRGTAPVAVVNETMARRFWHDEARAIDQCLRIGTDDQAPCTAVIGVVEDVKRMYVTESPTMQFYVPMAQAESIFPMPVTSLLVRASGAASSVLPAVRAVPPVDGFPAMSATPLTEIYDWQFRTWRIGATLLGMFGALALLLMAIGLYGLLSHVLAVRTRELGIRMALGASVSRVRGLLAGHALAIGAAGAAAGLGSWLAVGRRITPLLFAVNPFDPVVLMAAGAVVLLVVLGSASGPARRSGTIHPSVALRCE